MLLAILAFTYAKFALAAAVAICFKLLPGGIYCNISLVIGVCLLPLIPVVLFIANFPARYWLFVVLCWLRGEPNDT